MTPETNEELLYIQIKTLNVPHIDRTTIEYVTHYNYY